MLARQRRRGRGGFQEEERANVNACDRRGHGKYFGCLICHVLRNTIGWLLCAPSRLSHTGEGQVEWPERSPRTSGAQVGVSTLGLHERQPLVHDG